MTGILIALRGLARSPGNTILAVATLALGIGSATAMFSVIHASLLRPLPYPEPDRLIHFRDAYRPSGGSGSISIANYTDIRRETQTLAEVAAFASAAFNVAAGEVPDRASGLRVTSNFLRTLGSEPVIGRGFLDGEDRMGRADIAVISHRLWRDRYDGRADAIGASILLNSVPHEIVGVLPPDFWFPGDPAIIATFGWTAEALEQSRGQRWLDAVARLAPGVEPPAADAELNAIMSRLAELYPESNEGWGIRTSSLVEYMLGSNRTSLLLLNGAVLLLLMIGIANVANLILVRAERGTRDTALRLALGATRTRITARFVGEGLLLSTIGAVLGMVVAIDALRLLLVLFGDDLPRAGDAALTLPVLAFAAGLTIVAGTLIGLVPAARMRTADIHDALRDGGRGARRGSRLQHGLVAAEVAVAVLLVCGATLMINSFWHLNRVDTGLRIDDTLVFTVQLPGATYASREAVAQFYNSALDAISNIPGVASAGISERTPLQGGLNMTTVRSPDDPDITASFVEVRSTTPDFFAAAGIPLLAGRSISAEDVAEQRTVTVISDVLARTLFPDSDPLGRSLLASGDNPGYEIVGVIGSVRDQGVTQVERPAMYWPFQVGLGQGNTMVFVVHAPRDPLAVMPAIRREITALDATLPVFDVRLMKDVVRETVGPRWVAANLFTAFGAIALVLAALGIFSVLAYVVEQRTREIGIRMALGATAAGVRSMVVMQGLRLVGIGLVVGLAAAAWSSKLLSDLLWEVEPTDPATFAIVAVIALATAATAALLPAIRATRVQPAVALGED